VPSQVAARSVLRPGLFLVHADGHHDVRLTPHQSHGYAKLAETRRYHPATRRLTALGSPPSAILHRSRTDELDVLAEAIAERFHRTNSQCNGIDTVASVRVKETRRTNEKNGLG
jgi:hypothetical protein